MTETVIVSAARTPVGKFGGTLKDIPATALGSIAIQEVMRRAPIEGRDVDLAIIGQVLQAGCGQIPSRQATLGAGLPDSVPSETINKVCASSFRAVTMADQLIRSGDAGIVLAGGMESMSNAPYADKSLRWGQRMFDSKMTDLMIHDGLWCATYNRHMAVHGGVVAKEFQITRRQQDEWALRSQQRACLAIEKGYLEQEIVPVAIKGRKGEFLFSKDESPRPDVTLEALAALPPLFTPDNSVTAGNAPGTNDAAGALLLMSERRAKETGARPLARIVAHAMASEDPAYIATAPGRAVNRLLKKVGMSIDDIDLIEVNEAFAAVPLVSQKIAGWDPEKVNVNGGSVAFGHAIGASGARIIMTLAYELRRRGLSWGVAAICSGGGQGDAILVNCED